MKIGKGLKILLNQKGWSQKDFAKEIGISETSLSLIIQGKTQPRKETLELISDSLGIKPELLVVLSLEEEDIPEHRKEYFSTYWPTIESQLKTLLQDEA